jgi:hypothetical protein
MHRPPAAHGLHPRHPATDRYGRLFRRRVLGDYTTLSTFVVEARDLAGHDAWTLADAYVPTAWSGPPPCPYRPPCGWAAESPTRGQLNADHDGDRLHGQQGDQNEQLDRTRRDRRGAAQQHPDERTRQRDQADRTGLVQSRYERGRRVRPTYLQRGIAIRQADGQGGFDLSAPPGQLLDGPPAGQGRGGQRAPDENAGDRDHRDAT